MWTIIWIGSIDILTFDIAHLFWLTHPFTNQFTRYNQSPYKLYGARGREYGAPYSLYGDWLCRIKWFAKGCMIQNQFTLSNVSMLEHVHMVGYI